MHRVFLLTSLLLSTLHAYAAAQAPAAGALTGTASLRARGEAWNWFGASEGGEYEYLGATLRAGLAQQKAGFGWQVELAAPLLLGLPDDAIEPAPRGQAGVGASYYAASGEERNTASAFLKQAYLRFGAAPGARGHGVRVGRIEFVEGAERAPGNATLAAVKRDRVAHRLLGNFGWSHVGRSFDGASYAYSTPRLTLTTLAARPTQGVFDVNGWPELDIGVAYAALTLPQEHPRHPGEARLFALHYLDYRDAAGLVKADNRPLEARRADRADVSVTTVGGHYLRALSTGAGTVDVMLWGALQAGAWGEQDHRAWAAAAEAGLQPPLLGALRPWLRAGWSQGSGDGRAGDDRHATFFQVLPTPRIYARLPFYNLMNTREIFGSLSLRPGARVSLRADVRSLRLAHAEDLWYSGGGAFEPESFGFAGRPSGGESALGTLADLSADLRLTPRLTATAYLGWMDGGAVVERIYPDAGGARLGYLELEYRR